MADEAPNTENAVETETVEQVSEEVENPEQEVEAADETAETESTEESSDLSDEVKKWKALSRKNEERAAENKRLLEDFVKQNEDFHNEREAFNAERANFIKERALTKAGLSVELSALLSGNTPEEVEAQVQLISNSLPTAHVEQAKPVGTPYTPVEVVEDDSDPYLALIRAEMGNK